MAKLPNRSQEIIAVFMIDGAATLNQLASRVIQKGIFTDTELHHGSFQWVKRQCATALKERDSNGLPIAIITPQREGQAHVWVQLRFAGLDDCKYKLAHDIKACENDFQSRFPRRDFIEEKFEISLTLPTFGLLPGQDNWWKLLLDTSDNDDNPEGYTEEPGDEKC